MAWTQLIWPRYMKPMTEEEWIELPIPELLSRRPFILHAGGFKSPVPVPLLALNDGTVIKISDPNYGLHDEHKPLTVIPGVIVLQANRIPSTWTDRLKLRSSYILCKNVPLLSIAAFVAKHKGINKFQTLYKFFFSDPASWSPPLDEEVI